MSFGMSGCGVRDGSTHGGSSTRVHAGLSTSVERASASAAHGDGIATAISSRLHSCVEESRTPRRIPGVRGQRTHESRVDRASGWRRPPLAGGQDKARERDAATGPAAKSSPIRVCLVQARTGAWPCPGAGACASCTKRPGRLSCTTARVESPSGSPGGVETATSRAAGRLPSLHGGRRRTRRGDPASSTEGGRVRSSPHAVGTRWFTPARRDRRIGSQSRGFLPPEAGSVSTDAPATVLRDGSRRSGSTTVSGMHAAARRTRSPAAEP